MHNFGLIKPLNIKFFVAIFETLIDSSTSTKNS